MEHGGYSYVRSHKAVPDTTSQPMTTSHPSPVDGPEMLNFAPEPSSGSGSLRFLGLFALSLLLLLAGHPVGSPGLRLIACLGCVIFGVGGAPLQFKSDLEPLGRLILAVLIGFSVTVGAGALMADIRPLWHPVLAAALFGAAAAAMHLVAMRHRLWTLVRSIPRAGPTLTHLSTRSLSRVRPVPCALVLAGSALWLGSAIADNHRESGVAGFLTTISPLWYVGLGLLAISVAAARDDERLLWVAVLSIGLATTLTPALIYTSPSVPWAAPSMQLVSEILDKGHIDPGSGIHQAYSSFFAGIAWVCRAADVSNPLGIATYWPVAAIVVRVAELRFLAGRLISSPRRRWVAVTLAVLADSIGQAYFSPQAYGFIIALGLFGILVKGINRRPLSGRATFAVVALAGLVLGPTHELTPFMIAGVLVVLILAGEAPYWAPFLVVIPAAVWARLEFRVVNHFFSFADLFNLSNFQPPKAVATPGLSFLPEVPLSAHASQAGVAFLALAATVVLARHLRVRRMWGYWISAGVGLVFILFNPYGNEGILRASLFAIPWLALMAGQVAVPRIARGRRAVAVAIAGALVAMVALYVSASYTLDGALVLRRSDLDAVALFQKTAPPHSAILTVSPGAQYPSPPLFGSAVTVVQWPKVETGHLARQRGLPSRRELDRVTAAFKRVAHASGARPGTVLSAIWSRTALYDAEAYGQQTREQSLAWLRLFKTDPEWSLGYHSGGTYLFRYTGPA